MTGLGDERVERLFLSYARADQEFALRLATDMRDAGFPVWVDQLDILPSQLWDRTVEAALRDCAGLLLVLSPRSVASENVLDEVSIAIDAGKAIIPVLYEKCTLPLRLARIQFIDATRDYAVALTRCKAAVSGSPAAPVAAMAASLPPSGPRASLAPEIIEGAIANLTHYVGPIAPVLVQKAAGQAASEAELYSQLASSIPHGEERQAFLKRAGQARPASPPDAVRGTVFDAAFVDQVAAVLVHYLGPLARHTVAREQSVSPDRESLYQRLAARVPHTHERNELLRKLRAL